MAHWVYCFGMLITTIFYYFLYFPRISNATSISIQTVSTGWYSTISIYSIYYTYYIYLPVLVHLVYHAYEWECVGYNAHQFALMTKIKCINKARWQKTTDISRGIHSKGKLADTSTIAIYISFMAPPCDWIWYVITTRYVVRTMCKWITHCSSLNHTFELWTARATARVAY